MTNISDDQESFGNCIGALVKSLPESKKDISVHTGVSVSAINNLLSSKAEVSADDLQKLYAYFNCTYELGQSHDEIEFHDFRLSGGYTVFPTGRKRIVELYNSVSHGGDLVFAYQLVRDGGYTPNHTRYLLLHTCYYLYTLMIIKEQGDLVDQLIGSDVLINFTGDRVGCSELFHALDQHEYRIGCEPQNRRTFDEEFFEDKDLVFAQLAPSIVVTDEIGVTHGLL